MSNSLNDVFSWYSRTSLILRIIAGMIIGTILGVTVPKVEAIYLLGDFFVGALKAIAPVLVFFLVTSSLIRGRESLGGKFRLVIWLYVISTLCASVLSVVASFLFPISLTLPAVGTSGAAPEGIGEVLKNVLIGMISNPLVSISEGRYLGILFWAAVLGLAMKGIASETTKQFLHDCADGVSKIVKWIIGFAPFGILGLVYNNVSTNGVSFFSEYAGLLALLVGTMLFVALVANPLIVFIMLRKNPYPLVYKCLKESGVTAFFTRSSAANIPLNMELCRHLKLDEEVYSVSIPLGATINMSGAAVTITIFVLAAVNTLGISVDVPSAILLSFMSAVGACGASGVAGGSLLLIPMACALFGIDQNTAMQVVGVGFIVGVVQDSFETAINSSSDALFAATAEYSQWKKEGKPLPEELFS